MNIKSFFATAALCFLPLASQAGVFYEWTATNDDIPWGITLQLEFDRRTVNAGEFKLDLEYNYHSGEEVVIPTRGLMSLTYTVPGNFHNMYYTSHNQTGFTFPRGNLMLDLKFLDDGFLAGTIFTSDGNSQIELTSVGKTFTVVDARSDEEMYGAGCDSWPTVCGGATGFIQKVGEVPEPASIALLALGAVGLASARRRKLVE